MKNVVLSLTCVLVITSAAFAQSSFTATPSTFNISGTSGFFDVTIGLTTDATSISSFDLFLGSNSAGANAFSIFSNTSLIAESSQSGNNSYPDAIAAPTNPSNPVNYFTYQNYDPDGAGTRPTADLGWSYAIDQTINGSISLETLRITYNFGSLPTPGTMFTFSTTPTGTAGDYHSYFYQGEDNGLALTQADQTSFTVTFTAVPEPSTWFAGIAAAGAICFTMLHCRQTANDI